jgi:DUF1009 family protein
LPGSPIGLIAGSGKLPRLFAEAARQAGREVIAVGHEGETDPALEPALWVKLGQLGKIASALREAGCTQAVLCGGIRKPKLFDVRPDWLAVKVLARLRSFGDDAALRAIAAALEEEGIEIVSPLGFVPALLAPKGKLGKRSLSGEQRKDVEVGLQAARALGAEDIGQTVVVKRGVVLAVEAVEGTDACIARGGALAPDAVVVKVSKPGQDLRFDVPSIGMGTVETMRAARCAALAVAAGKTLVLDDLSGVADLAIEGVECW